MIRVRFWGTRGSITTPGQETLQYGGNTPCVEIVGLDSSHPGAAIQSRNPHLILDGGTGLTRLQNSLLSNSLEARRKEFHILLSHYHWDHLIGIPFFSPMFIKGNRVTFYGSSIDDLQASIEQLFTSNYSPHKGVQNVSAELLYRQIPPEGMTISDFQVQTVEARHPNTTLTYKIQRGPYTVVYTTDHEAGDKKVDSRLIELARGADLWILDAHFTAEERQQRIGWGHSSHLEAVQLAVQASVKRVILFHHAPEHNDQILGEMEMEAVEAASKTDTGVLMARDGMALEVGALY